LRLAFAALGDANHRGERYSRVFPLAKSSATIRERSRRRSGSELREHFKGFLVDSGMSFINLEQLPFVGMSYEFVGETEGAPFSAYLVKAKPGEGPPLHKHPYVEVAFTLEGCATITVGNETREVKAGGIVVIPANTPHRFVNSGETVLRQIDVHASPKFIQTNL
jgi:mannose-6-phosphate isomerase-like protein (cupin superfamily)